MHILLSNVTFEGLVLGGLTSHFLALLINFVTLSLWLCTFAHFPFWAHYESKLKLWFLDLHFVSRMLEFGLNCVWIFTNRRQNSHGIRVTHKVLDLGGNVGRIRSYLDIYRPHTHGIIIYKWWHQIQVWHGTNAPNNNQMWSNTQLFVNLVWSGADLDCFNLYFIFLRVILIVMVVEVKSSWYWCRVGSRGQLCYVWN